MTGVTSYSEENFEKLLIRFFQSFESFNGVFFEHCTKDRKR
jgi:hypothetical protein